MSFSILNPCVKIIWKWFINVIYISPPWRMFWSWPDESHELVLIMREKAIRTKKRRATFDDYIFCHLSLLLAVSLVRQKLISLRNGGWFKFASQLCSHYILGILTLCFIRLKEHDWCIVLQLRHCFWLMKTKWCMDDSEYNQKRVYTPPSHQFWTGLYT